MRNLLEKTLKKIIMKKLSKEELILLAKTTTYTEILKKLSDTDDLEILSAVAGNENTSPEILEKMVDEKGHRNILLAVAGNSAVSDKILYQIPDQTDDRDVLKAVANKTDDDCVLFKVACNKNTSPETLNSIVEKIDDEDVLEEVAKNINTSSETLKMIKKLLEIEEANRRLERERVLKEEEEQERKTQNYKKIKSKIEKKVALFFVTLIILINIPMILFSPFIHKTNGLEWIHIFFVVLVPFVVSIITEYAFKFYINKNSKKGLEDILSIEDKLIIVKKHVIKERNILLNILIFFIFIKLILTFSI